MFVAAVLAVVAYAQNGAADTSSGMASLLTFPVAAMIGYGSNESSVLVATAAA